MVTRYFALLIPLFLLLSCGDEGAPSTEGPYVPPPANQVAFRNTDDNVRVGIRGEPDILNPVLSTSGTSRVVNEMIFQSLNAEDPEDFSLLPVLASLPEVQVEENRKVGYAYRINENARWPNGTPVTAADVVFSIKLVLNPLIQNGAYRAYYDFVENVMTSPNDERRFKVMTDGPYLLAKGVLGDTKIFPEYVYDPEKSLRKVRLSDLANERKANELAGNNEVLIAFSEKFNALSSSRDPKDLIGSGAYELQEWKDGQEIILTKRDNFWGKSGDNPWLGANPQTITFKIIPDPNTMATAMRDELVDMVINMDIDKFKDLREEPFLQDRFNFSTVDGFAYFGLLFNQQDPKFKDAATRRAIAQLVNVDELINQLFSGGLAKRVNGPVMSAKTYYNDAIPLIEYNQAKAVAALNAAGWQDTNGNGTLDRSTDGELQELVIDFLTFTSPTGEAVGTMIKEWFEEAGVAVNLQPRPFPVIREAMNKGDFSMALSGQQYISQPDDFTQVWASTSVPPNGTNRGGFSNKEADRLINRINTTMDAEKREPLYRRFQEILYEEQPMVFLFSPRDRIVVSRRFDAIERPRRPNVFFNSFMQHDWNKGK